MSISVEVFRIIFFIINRNRVIFDIYLLIHYLLDPFYDFSFEIYFFSLFAKLKLLYLELHVNA